MMGPGVAQPNSVTLNPNGNTGMAKSCAGCGGRIADRFLLHALERYWHTGCLKCSCCQGRLGEIGTSCFTKAGMILCRNDYVRLFGPGASCCGCGQAISASELVMRAQANVYHLKCFTCVQCHAPLNTGDRFGLVHGSLVCEHDFPKVSKGQGHIQAGQGHSPASQGHMNTNNNTPLPNRTSHKVC